GTGQIDMGRDRPERTFTPTPTEYEGVGRNVVDRQAGADILRLESRKTITQGEMIELTRQFREAVTTKPINRTDEQKQLIQALPKLKKQVNAGAVPVTQNMQSDLDHQLAGQPIDSEWTEFARESGTLNVPRAQMPQVKAEHRGALVNFLNAQGVKHQQLEIDPVQLKPTQQEFAPGKVDRARQHKGGERSILISSDGHVVDGHHQWMAKRERGEPVKAIQLQAPIRELLPMVSEFPSSARDEGAVTTPDTPATTQGAAPELRMKSDGSPFASEIAAKRSTPYKQNIEYAEVVPVDGGFAVLVDTQAQDEADTKAVEQQQARTQQAKTRMYRAPDPVNDDMLDAIALLGGIDRAEAEAEGVDPANFGRQAGGIRYLFPRNGGDSFDGMAERIAQYGYLNANADRLDDFRAKLDQAINGSRKVMTPQGYEALAEKELAAEAQLQEEHEPLAGDITSDEAWAGEAYAMALEAGVPINVIDAILEQYGADPIATLVELNDAINEVNNARAAQAGEGTQGRSADTEIPWNEPGNLSDVDINALFGEPEQDAEPLLTSYTESDLQAQADAQTVAEQAEADAQRSAEQKAQADAEVNDFTLSGSNRPADVAASRGQNDMFGLGSRPAERQTEPAVPAQQPPEKKQYIPTGIQSGIGATDQLNELISNGEPVSADEVRRVFDYVVGNEASVRAELNKLKKDQLKRIVNGHVWSDTKKAELVDRA
ncbi:hypothetical protein, partial [Stutzerimonas frequens]|uniref:hypothetical protein n=1 Tax=Stutzerimonas frequens TaxID=2968969 RepID=UPI0022DE7535